MAQITLQLDDVTVRGLELTAHDGHDVERVSLAAPGWHLPLLAITKRNIHSNPTNKKER